MIAKRHATGLALVCLAVSLPFVLLHFVGRQSIINEVRHHVMGVAIATAAGVDGDMLDAISGDDAVASPAYRQIQSFLDRIALANPDVRYIYTMRPSRDPLSAAWMVEYVVDQPERDTNRNGTIDPSEKSEMPGSSYDASNVPELLNGFHEPSADHHITPDPPYPDLISGYAPVRNQTGKVTGLVGVDVTADTIRAKLVVLRVVMTSVWLVICALIGCIYLLYLRQRDAFERVSSLTRELTIRNEMLRSANTELAQLNRRFEEDLLLAQKVQKGFLPTRFPRHDRIVFDQYYLTCEILGGDLYDAFEIDEDHVGVYIADVAGHGVSAALISGLLKMAVSTLRQQKSGSTTTMFVDLAKPDHFLRSINSLLAKEMPEGEFITMIYCVFDLLNNRMILGNAGHPRPIIYRRKTGVAEWCNTRNGMALGLDAVQEYACTEHPIESGDLALFYTDGLTEAINAEREEFGEERLISLVNLNDVNNASQLNDLIRQAVSKHRGGQSVSDDFTLLTIEVR